MPRGRAFLYQGLGRTLYPAASLQPAAWSPPARRAVSWRSYVAQGHHSCLPCSERSLIHRISDSRFLIGRRTHCHRRLYSTPVSAGSWSLTIWSSINYLLLECRFNARDSRQIAQRRWRSDSSSSFSLYGYTFPQSIRYVVDLCTSKCCICDHRHETSVDESYLSAS